jgi:hypothetical protein
MKLTKKETNRSKQRETQVEDVSTILKGPEGQDRKGQAKKGGEFFDSLLKNRLCSLNTMDEQVKASTSNSEKIENAPLSEQFNWISNWLEKHGLFQTLDTFLNEGLTKLQINDQKNVIIDESYMIEVVLSLSLNRK